MIMVLHFNMVSLVCYLFPGFLGIKYFISYNGVSGLNFKLIGTNEKNVFWSQKLALPFKKKSTKLILQKTIWKL